MDKLSLIVGAISITGSVLVILVICLIAVYQFNNRKSYKCPSGLCTPSRQTLTGRPDGIGSADDPQVTQADKNDYHTQLLNDFRAELPAEDRSKIDGKTAEQIARAEAAINARRDANGRYILPAEGSHKTVVEWRHNAWIEK